MGSALPPLSDGISFLRPLTLADVGDHLDCEDEQTARWLSGGHSTLETVRAYIERCIESWRTGGTLRAFGVFEAVSGRLVGSIEANAQPWLAADQVNISFGIRADRRGRGLAGRALALMEAYIREARLARELVLQIDPANAVSIRVAEKAGFAFAGVVQVPPGSLARYVRALGSAAASGTL